MKKIFIVIFVLCGLFYGLKMASAESIPPEGYYYVIVTIADFKAACEPMRQLRSYDSAHQAIIITVEQIPAALPGRPTGEELRAYFQSTLYPQPPAGFGTDYILLVGDLEFVSSSVFLSDPYLTNFFGSKPEIAIGRLSANSPTDITNYYNKILPGGPLGTIIDDGKDHSLIFSGSAETFVEPKYLQEIWEPYLGTATVLNQNYRMTELIEVINSHSLFNNIGHGYGPGLIPQWAPIYSEPHTNLNPIYYAFGCQSAAFQWNFPYEHPAEHYTNLPSSYSAIIGSPYDVWSGGHSTFYHNFYKAYFLRGYAAVGDMLNWAIAQGIGPVDRMILLGDPYLKIVSSQFLNAPRIYVDSGQKSYKRIYNLDNGTGIIDEIAFSVYAFNSAQWRIDNITYSEALPSSHINIFPLSSSNVQEVLRINFVNPDGIVPGDYVVGFDIVDISGGLSRVIKHITVPLSITNTNVLDEGDFIIQGNQKILPGGYYVLANDLIVKTGTTLVIAPGVNLGLDWQFGGNWKIVVESGANFKAIGSVENPILFIKDFGVGSGVMIEFISDGAPDYQGEFAYCFLANQIIGINTPRLKFDNCTFLGTSQWMPLFPNAVKGEMKNSVVGRWQMGQPAEGGYLSGLKVSYSVVPRSFKGTGKGILWDYEGLSWDYKPEATSLCINAGDPEDLPDPDGTRKDIGAYYFPLYTPIRVPQDYPTIQQALDVSQATATKVVMVSSGTYQENLNLPSGVRLMGESSLDRPLLSGAAGPLPLIAITAGDGNNSLIENFILTKQGFNQAGNVILNNQQFHLLMLRNTDIRDCRDAGNLIQASGELYLSNIKFTGNSNNQSLVEYKEDFSMRQSWMKDSLFENNANNACLVSFYAGGPVDFALNNVKFVNNSNGALLVNNTLDDYSLSIPYSLIVENSTFYNNDAVDIQALAYGNTVIENSTFYNNGAANGMNINLGGNSRFKVHNSILWDNKLIFTKAETALLEVDYSDINSLHTAEGIGNINQNPLFVDETQSDFHLQPGSPAVNTGDPNSAVPLYGGARIDMGAFELLQDTTPPTIPIVTDEGDSTTNLYQLSASWTTEDAETDVVEYEYRISEESAISGAVVKDWTPSLTDAVLVNGLNLMVGRTYYFGVRAKNGAGAWSDIGYSDGILASTTGTNQPLKGDVNKDSSVDILDIQSLVNHILGTQDYGVSADVNSDGFVDVLDVQAVVNIILVP